MNNSLIIIFISLFLFGLGYYWYAKKLESLWEVDPKRPTPAVTKYDGIDYVPAKNWLVLFGHHFSSIAGAGPIIGPTIACLVWGWLPALLWIILGTVFIGGAHDFGSLITSVQEEGVSLPQIAEKTISLKAKIFFSLFVWLSLILVIAVFAFLCADTFVKEPKIIVPSLGLIPVAILIGFFLYFKKINSFLTTILGITLLFSLIYLGYYLPVSLGKYSLYIWLTILFIYAYFASVLPVNILLQPRDYLSSYLLFLGLGVGLLGVFISRPIIKMPAYLNWNTDNGWLWPMLFVTVACGAISGFHSLIAGGTTSKQLSNENTARKIGYGAMVAEGLLATIVVIAVASLNLPKENLAYYLKSRGPISIFSQGYENITSVFFKKSGFFAVLILNAFILTTLDTATRICRYITEELFNIRRRFVSTLIVIVASAILAFSKKWLKIWPAFGAANQLVASLSLFLISIWLMKKKKSSLFTLPIAFFMLFTTIAALVFQIIECIFHKEYLLFIICILLIIFSGLMFKEIMDKIYNLNKIKQL